MKVVLVRKLADLMDGVDVRGYNAGDLLDLPTGDACALLAEQWAIRDRRESATPHSVERRSHRQTPSSADDDVEQAS